MIPVLQFFFHLLDLRHGGFAAWEQEMAAVDIRLTSGPWVGWHEEMDDPSHCG
ncbi:hypothetical protein QF015_004153 [Paenarthrobacter sp. TE4293]|uniref:hypothetical protein n=1 Tax=Paenarthrobacter sp. TE4293 TaxID=3381695 RepID=UPI003D2187A8